MSRETIFLQPQNNWITQDRLIPGSGTWSSGQTQGWKDGIVSGAQKIGLGSATATTSINTSSITNDTYYRDVILTLEIDSVAAGKEVGQATFKYRTNYDAPGTWLATGQATSGTPALNYNRIQVTFTGGTGNDFELGDQFIVTYTSAFGIPRLIDERRDTFFEWSGNSGIIIILDMGTPQIPECIAFLDIMGGYALGDYFNALSRVEGGNTGTGNNDFLVSQFFVHFTTTPTENHFRIFTENQPTPCRYWRIWMPKKSSSPVVLDPPLRIGQLYLGSYDKLAYSPTPDYGSGVSQRLEDGAKELSLKWDSLRSADMATLRGIYENATNNGERLRPIFTQLFSDEADSFYWIRPSSRLSHTFRTFGVDSANIDFEEVSKRYVI